MTIYNEWGKECHLDFLRRFEIISKVDDNDFDRAIEFSENGNQNLKHDRCKYFYVSWSY